MKVDDRSNSTGSNKASVISGRKMQNYIHVNVDSRTENFQKYPAFVEYNMHSIRPKKPLENNKYPGKLSTISIKRPSQESDMILNQKFKPTYSREGLKINSTSRKKDKVQVDSASCSNWRKKMEQELDEEYTVIRNTNTNSEARSILKDSCKKKNSKKNSTRVQKNCLDTNNSNSTSSNIVKIVDNFGLKAQGLTTNVNKLNLKSNKNSLLEQSAYLAKKLANVASGKEPAKTDRVIYNKDYEISNKVVLNAQQSNLNKSKDLILGKTNTSTSDANGFTQKSSLSKTDRFSEGPNTLNNFISVKNCSVKESQNFKKVSTKNRTKKVRSQKLDKDHDDKDSVENLIKKPKKEVKNQKIFTVTNENLGNIKDDTENTNKKTFITNFFSKKKSVDDDTETNPKNKVKEFGSRKKSRQIGESIVKKSNIKEQKNNTIVTSPIKPSNKKQAQAALKRMKNRSSLKLNFDKVKINKRSTLENNQKSLIENQKKESNPDTAKTTNYKQKLNFEDHKNQTDENFGKPAKPVMDYNQTIYSTKDHNEQSKHKRIMSQKEQTSLKNNTEKNAQKNSNIYLPRNYTHAQISYYNSKTDVDQTNKTSKKKSIKNIISFNNSHIKMTGDKYNSLKRGHQKSTDKKSVNSNNFNSKKSIDNLKTFQTNQTKTKQSSPNKEKYNKCNLVTNSSNLNNNTTTNSFHPVNTGNMFNKVNSKDVKSFITVGSPRSNKNNNNLVTNTSKKVLEKIDNKKLKNTARSKSREKGEKSVTMKQSEILVNNSLSQNETNSNTKNFLSVHENWLKHSGKNIQHNPMLSILKTNNTCNSKQNMGNKTDRDHQNTARTTQSNHFNTQKHQNNEIIDGQKMSLKISKQLKAMETKKATFKKNIKTKKDKVVKTKAENNQENNNFSSFNIKTDIKNVESFKEKDTKLDSIKNLESKQSHNVFKSQEDLANIDYRGYLRNCCAEIIQKTWRLYSNRKNLKNNKVSIIKSPNNKPKSKSRERKVKNIEKNQSPFNTIKPLETKRPNSKFGEKITGNSKDVPNLANINLTNHKHSPSKQFSNRVSDENTENANVLAPNNQSNSDNSKSKNKHISLEKVKIKKNNRYLNKQDLNTIQRQPKPIKKEVSNNDPKTRESSLTLKEFNQEQSRTIIGDNNSHVNLSNSNFVKKKSSSVVSETENKSFIRKYKTFATDQIKRWEDVMSNIKQFQKVNISQTVAKNKTQDFTLKKTDLFKMLCNLEKQGTTNLRILQEMIKVQENDPKGYVGFQNDKLKQENELNNKLENLFTNKTLEKLGNEGSDQLHLNKDFSSRIPNSLTIVEEDKCPLRQSFNEKGRYILNCNNNHLKEFSSKTGVNRSSNKDANQFKNIQDTLSSNLIDYESEKYCLEDTNRNLMTFHSNSKNIESSLIKKRDMVKSDGILINTDILNDNMLTKDKKNDEIVRYIINDIEEFHNEKTTDKELSKVGNNLKSREPDNLTQDPKNIKSSSPINYNEYRLYPSPGKEEITKKNGTPSRITDTSNILLKNDYLGCDKLSETVENFYNLGDQLHSCTQNSYFNRINDKDNTNNGQTSRFNELSSNMESKILAKQQVMGDLNFIDKNFMTKGNQMTKLKHHLQTNIKDTEDKYEKIRAQVTTPTSHKKININNQKQKQACENSQNEKISYDINPVNHSKLASKSIGVRANGMFPVLNNKEDKWVDMDNSKNEETKYFLLSSSLYPNMSIRNERCYFRKSHQMRSPKSLCISKASNNSYNEFLNYKQVNRVNSASSKMISKSEKKSPQSDIQLKYTTNNIINSRKKETNAFHMIDNYSIEKDQVIEELKNDAKKMFDKNIKKTTEKNEKTSSKNSLISTQKKSDEDHKIISDSKLENSPSTTFIDLNKNNTPFRDKDNQSSSENVYSPEKNNKSNLDNFETDQKKVLTHKDVERLNLTPIKLDTPTQDRNSSPSCSKLEDTVNPLDYMDAAEYTSEKLNNTTDKCTSSQDTFKKNSLLDKFSLTHISDKPIDFATSIFPNVRKCLGIDLHPNINFRKKENSNDLLALKENPHTSNNPLSSQ